MPLQEGSREVEGPQVATASVGPLASLPLLPVLLEVRLCPEALGLAARRSLQPPVAPPQAPGDQHLARRP